MENRIKNMEIYRVLNHNCLPENYNQGLYGDSELAAKHITELLNQLDERKCYSIDGLNKQDSILQDARDTKNQDWLDFPIIEGYVKGDPKEQSISEKIMAITIHYGRCNKIIDPNNPNGMFVTIYSCGVFSARFATNSGFGQVSKYNLYTPPHVSIKFEAKLGSISDSEMI